MKRDIPLAFPAKATTQQLQIKGYRVESSDREPNHGEDNIPELLQGTMATLRLFGSGFSEQTTITFTEERNEFGGPCQMTKTDPFHVIKDSVTANGESALVEIKVPKTTQVIYLCARQAENKTAGLVS